VGDRKDTDESDSALGQAFMITLFVIYGLLAIPFRSYLQPFLVMSIIPFGLVGAAEGHLFFDIPLSRLSLFGLVALTGVVINDSLVLVHYINRKRGQLKVMDSVREAGAARFRPIILTSLTTFVGLLPILFERSLQAQFLKPMAISIGFGVLFATFITLILVPVLYLVLEDCRVWALDAVQFLGLKKGHRKASH
jgi:multidrug efflux pump subunit AcrB